MYQGKTVLALILARGKSKGLPRKNIKNLLGKPLIGWTVAQALHSRVIDAVVVSTDSKEIARIARAHGAEVPFLRPEKFARDHSSSIDAVQHAIDWLRANGRHYDYTVLLEPTSPLRGKKDLDRALKQLVDQQATADALVSLGEIHIESPFISYQVDKNGYLEPTIPKEKTYKRRQELPVCYFPYGVIYAALTSKLLKGRTFYLKRTIPYFIERWQNYEIDDIYDFYCVEAIMKKKNREVV